MLRGCVFTVRQYKSVDTIDCVFEELEMTKACIASENWSKAEAEEDDRLTDSAAPSHAPCSNQSCVRKPLPHSRIRARWHNKTQRQQHHSIRTVGEAKNMSWKNEDTRDTTHNTQHRQIDPLSHCYYYHHTRLPQAGDSSQRRRREVGGKNKSGRTDETTVEEVDRG